MLDDLGLADPLLTLEHARLARLTLRDGHSTTTVADFSRLRTRFPFTAMLPQVDFLDFLVQQAREQPSFDLHMGSRVTDLIEEDGAIRGVRYTTTDGEHELRATLTVAADGRASRLRERAGWAPRRLGVPMDVMWLVLPRRDGDAARDITGFRIGRGRLIVVLARAHEWQLGYVVLKGDARAVREAGLDHVRTDIAALVPELADRVETIGDWTDLHFLSVESSRLDTWCREGLLAIGDAAHVMSPVGGVGINYAIQDAVATANRLAEPLRRGHVTMDDLAAIQRRRERPTRFIQAFQSIVQRLIVSRALADRPFRLPWPARVASVVPGLRNLPALIVGWGLRPERVARSRADQPPRTTASGIS